MLQNYTKQRPIKNVKIEEDGCVRPNLICISTLRLWTKWPENAKQSTGVNIALIQPAEIDRQFSFYYCFLINFLNYMTPRHTKHKVVQRFIIFIICTDKIALICCHHSPQGIFLMMLSVRRLY